MPQAWPASGGQCSGIGGRPTAEVPSSRGDAQPAAEEVGDRLAVCEAVCGQGWPSSFAHAYSDAALAHDGKRILVGEVVTDEHGQGAARGRADERSDGDALVPPPSAQFDSTV